MDAIAALSLASNIVQFVDFLWRLLREFRDLENSSTGTSAGNDVIEVIARDLVSHKDGLLALSSHSTRSEPMSRLVSRCKSIADELLEVLDEIKAKSPRNNWKSFVLALQSVRRKDQIGNLLERLEKLRAQMHFSVQLITR